jgi:hypothetical protein
MKVHPHTHTGNLASCLEAHNLSHSHVDTTVHIYDNGDNVMRTLDMRTDPSVSLRCFRFAPRAGPRGVDSAHSKRVGHTLGLRVLVGEVHGGSQRNGTHGPGPVHLYLVVRRRCSGQSAGRRAWCCHDKSSDIFSALATSALHGKIAG